MFQFAQNDRSSILLKKPLNMVYAFSSNDISHVSIPEIETMFPLHENIRCASTHRDMSSFVKSSVFICPYSNHHDVERGLIASRTVTVSIRFRAGEPKVLTLG